MIRNQKVIVVIPARYKSTRFPGKPLAEIQGKPLIYWVYNQAKKIQNVDDVFIATDDERIKETVENFGGKSVMTSERHATGTDRIAEAVEKMDADIIVNIQGDEPLFNSQSVEKAVNVLLNDKDQNISMTTLMTKIQNKEQYDDPNTVKVVTDKSGFALYFSRSLIPFPREKGITNVYKHIGIYGYRKNFLLKYTSMEQTPLEKTESLEQLRIIENGYKIKLIETKRESLSIDTPEDLELLKKQFKNIKGK